ncbi:MAG: FAD-dependent oxidoreductase [Candidatus Cloacimonetes bacterium]|nr:FAD-dependent oxidoreductase [Candidatus Cloacimonadota bacterium]
MQATIIKKARELGVSPEFILPEIKGAKVAIIGGGPSGIGTAVALRQLGYQPEIFDGEELGGQAALIPDARLDRGMLMSDLMWVAETFKIPHHKEQVMEPKSLLAQGYQAVVVAGGLNDPIRLNIPGDETAIYGMEILKQPGCFLFKGKRVALVGGAIAADQALTIAKAGAAHVEMITLESFAEMPLTLREKDILIEHNIQFSHRSRISEIVNEGGRTVGIKDQENPASGRRELSSGQDQGRGWLR